MSSSLKYSTTPPSSLPIDTIQRSAIPSPPAKKQKMSITQTYMLATVARRQLQKEANRADHDLRLLVGHANLLDGLMLDLANAEQEQESWFNQSVQSATVSEQSKHVQWADSHSIPEEAIVDDDEVYDEDSDDEIEQDTIVVPVSRKAKAPLTVITTAIDDEDQEMDDEFDDAELTLTRSPSHSTPSSPPELMMHEDSEDSESDEESMPPSPPQPEFPLNAFSQKQRQAIVTTSIFDPESQPIAIAAF